MTRPVGQDSLERKTARNRRGIESLARRPGPIIPEAGAMPIAYGFTDGMTFVDGNTYVLTFLDGEFYVGAYGTVETTGGIKILNDDNEDTFMAGPASSPEGLWIKEQGLYHYEAGVVLTGNPIPTADVGIFLVHPPTTDGTPGTAYAENTYNTAGLADLSVWISGKVLLDRSLFDPDTASESANGFAIAVQVDGNDVEVAEGWFMVAKMSSVPYGAL